MMLVFSGIFLFSQINTAEAETKYSITDELVNGGDCNTIGNWDPETKTCFLEQDLEKGDSISIESDGLTLDGQDYQLTGNSLGDGIIVEARENITIKNINISTFLSGITLKDGGNHFVENVFSEHNISTGLTIFKSHEIKILESNFSHNLLGIFLVESNDTIIRNNNFDSNDTWVLGFLIDNLIVNDNISQGDFGGIQLSIGSKVKITKNIISDGNRLRLNGINNSIISQNMASGSDGRGIMVVGGSNNIISKNTINNNSSDGLFLSDTSNNKIIKNQITKNGKGLRLGSGIILVGSEENDLTQNIVKNNNNIGITFHDSDSSNNNLLKNKSIGNGKSGFIINSNNNWIKQNISSKNQELGFGDFGHSNEFLKNICNKNDLGGSNTKGLCTPQK